MEGRFLYFSIPMVEEASYSLRRFRGATLSQSSTQNSTLLCLTNRVSAMKTPARVKIFPTSLQDLLGLSDQIQHISADSDGRSNCHGCGKRSAPMKKCSKCSFFWYCNKTCQTRGWNEKRHKISCKLLQDNDLRGIFLLDWAQVDNRISFPLSINAGGSATITKNTEEATNISNDLIQPAKSLYTIRSIAGKGKGLVAAERIVKGTRLLSEAPIFRVHRGISNMKTLEGVVENEVQRLTTGQKAAFFDLTNIYGGDHSESLGIARTNVLPLVGSDDASGGLFLDASRINHSCRHNAQNTWNENIGELTVHALRDIDPGQEITISYLTSTSEFAERQRHLEEKFKFKCKCELCSLPVVKRELSDKRLTNIQGIDRFIGAAFLDGVDPVAVLNILRMMFDLFEEEDIWDGRVARAYKDAFDIAMENDDAPRARIFATRAYKARCLIEGEDSIRTIKMKRAANQLSAQPPEGLDKAKFENWLWMEF
ncbi:hypothetical protein BDV35DRAFT_118881 [Aspergillus flavus]|nr:hypothetical protein BDV35DRAFT_118881 [Aspergillus flavus]